MSKCAICGEPMPAGEEMFNYHGYSGPCPKPAMLAAAPAEAPAERGEVRFFIDHGIVHDRKTGRHVGAAFEDDSADRLLALLRELENDAAAWRLTAKAMAAHAAPATNTDEISSKLVEPAAPAEGDWIAMISGIDEYGPMLDWNKHWSDVGVGTKLYTAPRVTGGREAIPAGVYYSPNSGNSHKAENRNGMGDEFHARWFARRLEFPLTPESALQAATGGEVES